MLTNRILDWLGHRIARHLEKETSGYRPYTSSDEETLCRILRPGDVLLIEGGRKISVAIKYLTQSTWSHAAIYIGDAMPAPESGQPRPRLVEVELGRGAIASPLSKYSTYNTRICRPVGLTDQDRDRVVRYMISRLGTKYDLRNIIDLARYLLPTPPVPVRWRRPMIALGSGSPTRAICSTMIAQAFQSVRYPILPTVQEGAAASSSAAAYGPALTYHIRHHSLFTPRDFDLSPYFRVIKPTIELGFDYQSLPWADADRPPSA
ncbi:MAG: lipo-like protein [Hyphomicrobiales bacterium]|nr:MAG: lipo-like protein [Hyphomicrobiales bacterium]